MMSSLLLTCFIWALMGSVFFGFFSSVAVLAFCLFSFFSSPSRVSVFFNKCSSAMAGSLSKNLGFFFLYLLFGGFIFVNILGNVPLINIPNMFYVFSFSVSLLFWVSMMVCVVNSQLKAFLAHMLPYGSPLGLILFLPLVEIFSQLIRPLTLIIRLSTNLSAGHIMLFMFSYFTTLSSVVSPFIYVVIFILFFLELCISVLQAYIFVSLLTLYFNETV